MLIGDSYMIGDIIFCRSSSPISWIIRNLTNSEWSHCIVSVSDDNSYIMESDIFQRCRVKRNRYDPEQTKTIRIPMTHEEQIQLLLFLLTYSDRGYDYRQIWGMFLRVIGLRKQENLWNSRNKIICSELIDRAFLKAGIDLVEGKRNGDVTPHDIYVALMEKYG